MPDLVQFPQDIVHQDGHSASLVLFSEQLEHGEAEGEGGGAAFPFGAIGGQDLTLEEAGQVASLGAVVGHALPAVPGEGLLQALCVLCLDFPPAAWGAFQEPSDAGEVCACHGPAFGEEEGGVLLECPVELLPVAAAVEPLVGKDDCGLYPHFAHHVAEGAGITHAARVALVEHRAGFLPVHGERVHEVDLGIMAAMGIAAALRIRHPAGIADDRGPVENCVEVFSQVCIPA